MNSDTGHIVADINDVENEKELYERLYGHEAEEASTILNGKRDCYIDLSEKTILANKARNIRKKKKKMSQKSKVKNRSK